MKGRYAWILAAGVGVFAVGLYYREPLYKRFLDKNDKIPKKIAFAVSRERFQETRPRWLGDDELLKFLRSHDIEVTKVVWDDPSVVWQSYDMVIVHQTWASNYNDSYYYRRREYFLWLEKLGRLNIPLQNSIPVIAKFFNKGEYLTALANEGVTVIPTKVLKKDVHTIRQIMEAAHWSEAVVKPAEGDSGAHIYRVILDPQQYKLKQAEFSAIKDAKNTTSVIKQADEFQPEFEQLSRDVNFIIQQYIPEIRQHGETSCVFINNQFKFAVNKKTKTQSHDFRTQRMYSGNDAQLITLNEHQVSLINNIYERSFNGFATHEQPLAARIDVIFTTDGNALLMEIEAIDPWLYWHEGLNGNSLSAQILQSYFEAIIEKYNQAKSLSSVPVVLSPLRATL